MRSRRRPPSRCEDNASTRTPGRFISSPRAIMRAPGRASSVWRKRVGIRSRVRWNAPTEGASPLVGSPRRGHIPFGTPVRIPHPVHLFCVRRRHSTVMGTVVGAFGGEGGIRTHGRVTPTAVFETARFGRSRTSPFVGCAEAPVGCVEMASASRLGELTVGQSNFQLVFFPRLVSLP